VMVDIATNKITDHIKYDAGALVMITGGRNAGRVGVIQRWGWVTLLTASFCTVHLTAVVHVTNRVTHRSDT
jgi:ribosomal protein S4E